MSSPPLFPSRSFSLFGLFGERLVHSLMTCMLDSGSSWDCYACALGGMDTSFDLFRYLFTLFHLVVSFIRGCPSFVVP